MAIFKIAAGENGKATVYRTEKDLRNLLFYSYNHSSFRIMKNLYLIGTEGAIECIYHQMLYLQWRRVKSLNTRALHYILSFDTLRWEKDVDQKTMTDIMSFLNEYLFVEYQHMLFLHLDKQSHYHIHMIVNPVNINTLHLCRETWKSIGWQIADLFLHGSNTPLLAAFKKREARAGYPAACCGVVHLITCIIFRCSLLHIEIIMGE